MDLMTALPALPQLSLLAILGYALFAFIFGLLLTPWFIRFLRRNKLGKQLRVETVDGQEPSVFRHYHQKKFGTPTMGGLLIWASIVVTILFSRLLALFGVVEFSLLQRREVYLPLIVLLSLGILGAIDDYLNIAGSDENQWKKLLRKVQPFFWITTGFALIGTVLLALGRFPVIADWLLPFFWLWALAYFGAIVALLDDLSKRLAKREYKKGGLAALPKLFSLLVIGSLGAYWFMSRLEIDSIYIPFLGDYFLGWWYIPVFIFILVGTANAVNFTDGLDGLAGGLLVISYASFAVLAYLSGLTVLAGFCAVCVGAIAAFLWHNVPPALFFMGDTGSLALGGTLGLIALVTDQVLILPFLGFIFVIEALSVIIQLTSKKLRKGKKVFKAAPIHHHFEALEWGESKVTMRFWIVGGFVAALGIIIGVAG